MLVMTFKVEEFRVLGEKVHDLNSAIGELRQPTEKEMSVDDRQKDFYSSFRF